MYKQELLSQVSKYSKLYPQIASQLANVKEQIEATEDETKLRSIATKAWLNLKSKV